MFDQSSFAEKHAFLKAYDALIFEAASTPVNSKMNHIANKLILKIMSVQKFSILVQKFILQNIFK